VERLPVALQALGDMQFGCFEILDELVQMFLRDFGPNIDGGFHGLGEGRGPSWDRLEMILDRLAMFGRRITDRPMKLLGGGSNAVERITAGRVRSGRAGVTGLCLSHGPSVRTTRATRHSAKSSCSHASGMCLAVDPRMSKHKSSSQSPDLRRIEHAGGPLPTSPTTELAELDTEAAIENPAEDSSAQHEGMHRPPAPSGKE
jgi:hypothetical protein